MSENEQASAGTQTILEKISRVPVLAVLVVLYLVFVLYIFPNSAYETEVGPLDLKFTYTPDTAYQTIEAYGEEGRARYAVSAMTVDVGYPVVYTLMFAVWITLALRGSKLSPARQHFASMLPFSVFVLDIMENTGIIAMLKTYPTRHDTLAFVTSLATSAKWSAAGVVIALTLVVTMHRLWRAAAGR
jgi:hypothetical protein